MNAQRENPRNVGTGRQAERRMYGGAFEDVVHSEPDAKFDYLSERLGQLLSEPDVDAQAVSELILGADSVSLNALHEQGVSVGFQGRRDLLPLLLRVSGPDARGTLGAAIARLRNIEEIS